MRAYEKRVFDEEAHNFITLWWYRIISHRSYVKGWKITPSHYLNQDLSVVWILDRQVGWKHVFAQVDAHRLWNETCEPRPVEGKPSGRLARRYPGGVHTCHLRARSIGDERVEPWRDDVRGRPMDAGVAAPPRPTYPDGRERHLRFVFWLLTVEC